MSCLRAISGLRDRTSDRSSCKRRHNTGIPSHRAEKTLNLVNAGFLAEGTYSFSASTLGSLSSCVGDRTTRSYSEMTTTDSRKMAFTASCQGHIDNGKYDKGRKSAFKISAGHCSRGLIVLLAKRSIMSMLLLQPAGCGGDPL